MCATPDIRLPAEYDSPAGQRWATVTLVSLATTLVVIGVVAGAAGAATSVVDFEAFDEGTELTTQYEDIGVRFEAQDGETAGALVVTCDPQNSYCDAARSGQNAAITPEQNQVSPTAFGVPREPLVAMFREPQAAVQLYVQDAGDLQGRQIATLTARNAAGDIVARQAIQFDVRTGWHEIGVTTESAVITEVTLTLALEGNQNDPHNLMAVDDLTFQRNESPNADLNYTPQNPTVGDEVSFSATVSGDTGNDIVEYRWDFTGNGTIDRVTQQPTVSTSYSNPDTHTVTLEIVYNDGTTARFTRPVPVIGPVARCSVSDTEIETGDQIVLDASGSTADLVRLDTDGDGDFDRTAGGDFREPITYQKAGTIRPRVRAEVDGRTDTSRCPPIEVSRSRVDGLPGSDIIAGGMGGLFGLWFLRRSHSELIDDDGGDNQTDDDGGDNHPPTAAIEFIPENPAPGQPVLFDGSGSVDPDEGDQVASYRWTVDDREIVGPRFVHSFLQDGDHEVELQVFDTHRAADTVKKTVTAEVPEGELTLDETHPDAPGNDHENLNEEFIALRNVGDAALDVGGWTIHDTAEAEGQVTPGDHTFRFPDEFELGSDNRVTVHTGAMPEDSGPSEDADGERHLYWNKSRAIWNNDEDVIVVENSDGHPVLAIRYRRTESGTYELEDMDVEVLDGWFGRVVVSRRSEEPHVSFFPVAEIGIELVPGLVGVISGATFLKGPEQFLYSWANITGFFISSSIAWAMTTMTNVLPQSMGPIIPLLLVVGSVSMTVIGRIGVAVQTSVQQPS